jgi:hypothetical protein
MNHKVLRSFQQSEPRLVLGTCANPLCDGHVTRRQPGKENRLFYVLYLLDHTVHISIPLCEVQHGVLLCGRYHALSQRYYLAYRRHSVRLGQEYATT